MHLVTSGGWNHGPYRAGRQLGQATNDAQLVASPSRRPIEPFPHGLGTTERSVMRERVDWSTGPALEMFRLGTVPAREACWSCASHGIAQDEPWNRRRQIGHITAPAQLPRLLVAYIASWIHAITNVRRTIPHVFVAFGRVARSVSPRRLREGSLELGGNFSRRPTGDSTQQVRIDVRDRILIDHLARKCHEHVRRRACIGFGAVGVPGASDAETTGDR